MSKEPSTPPRRDAHTADGTEFYPTLWEKAGALLWALATTQGFTDGNKRTAWTAMETFLALNGEFLRTSVVDAHEVTGFYLSAGFTRYTGPWLFWAPEAAGP